MRALFTFFLALFFINPLMAQENGGPYTPDQNTVLLMHFDGDVNNAVSTGTNGIVHGSGVSYENGIHGQCLRLDNSTTSKQSWIEVPFYNALNFSNEFSIECWFKISSWGNNQTMFPIIIKKGNGYTADYEIKLDSKKQQLQGNLNCIDDGYYRHSNNNTTDIIEPGKWYYVTIYFDFSKQHFFLLLRDENFKEIFSSRDYTYTKPFNSNDKLYLGYGNSGDSYFDGCIDELRISNQYRKYRDDFVSAINESELKDSVSPLLNDKWKVYQWPFMAYYPISSKTGERNKGNSCGITAMMRVIHFWEYPRFPQGNVDFDDGEFHWQADFDTTQYRYDEMPKAYGSSPTQKEYDASATLSAQIAAPAKYFVIGANGAPIKTIMQRYFKYNKNVRWIYREEYTKAEWEKLFKNELSHGRPILLGGIEERYDDGNYAGHFYICDGYNADNKFHTDLSIGNTEYWIDVDSFPYGKEQYALIYDEPDWQGKKLTLEYPKGGEYLQNKNPLNIKWNATNIDKVLLEYSTDGGWHWKPVANNVDASSGSYSWTIPDIASDSYKIRVSDVTDGNVYRHSKTFHVFNQKTIAFDYPLNNTYFQSGTSEPIYWESEGIPAFKLEYNDGSGWQPLCDSVSSDQGMLICQIPDVQNQNFVLKATDLSDDQAFFESDPFRVLPKELIGGVYKKDDKTVLLMHFEKDITNAVKNDVIPGGVSEASLYQDNYTLNLGKAYRISNTENDNWNCLEVPYTSTLDLGNNWTIETWVKYNEIGTSRTEYPYLITNWDSYRIDLNGQGNGFNGFVKFDDQSKVNFFQNQPLEKGRWYHVALSSNAATRKVYFYVHDDHRKLIYSDSKDFPSGASGNLDPSTNDLMIGGVAGNSNVQFDGWLDELRIAKEPVDYSTMITKTLDHTLISGMTCYPNPVSESSVIRFTMEKSDNVNLTIYDLQGKKVFTLIKKKLEAGVHTVPIGKQLKANGIYFCNIITSKGSSTLKVVVE